MLLDYKLILLKKVCFIFTISLECLKLTDAINCFECTSYNHDNPDCEDPFFRSDKISLNENCMTGIPSKQGSFRATHCLKLIAEGHGRSYVIRTCTMDTGSGRMDQEIVRESHCGYLSLENFYGLAEENTLNSTQKRRPSVFNGCLSVCSNDECNSAKKKFYSNFLLFLISNLILNLITQL